MLINENDEIIIATICNGKFYYNRCNTYYYYYYYYKYCYLLLWPSREKSDWSHFPIVMLMVVVRTRKRLVIGNKTNTTTTMVQNIIEKEKNIPNRYWYLNPHGVRVSRLKFYWIYTCTSWHRLGWHWFWFHLYSIRLSPDWQVNAIYIMCFFFQN